MKRTRQELGLKLVPQKRLLKMVSVPVPCPEKQHLLHFMSLSKPPHTPPLLLLCYDHIAEIRDEKSLFINYRTFLLFIKCY